MFRFALHARFRAARAISLGLLAALITLGAGPVFAQTRFTPQQLRQDLAAMHAHLDEVHPDVSHSVAPRALARAFDRIDARLTRPLTRDQAWAALARLNSLTGDGHLALAFADNAGDAKAYLGEGGGFFPFEVDVGPSGDLRIVSRLGGAPSAWRGRVIARINGRDARVVASALLERVAGDTPAMRRALLSARWPLLYWRLHGRVERFALTFVDAASSVERVDADRALPKSLDDGADFDRTFGFTTRADGVGVLRIGAFWWEDKAKFLAFTRDAFDRLRAERARCLIIDLRGNTGGDDDMWRDGVLPYLADKPYRWGSRYRKRVLAPFADAGQVVGSVVDGEIEDLIAPGPASRRFGGEVVAMMGPSTYSSSILFANTLQDFGFARLAGAGGAVRATQTGSIQRRVLPNTGLIFWVPRFVLQRPSGARAPTYLTPDVPITDDALDPGAAIDLAARTACRSNPPR